MSRNARAISYLLFFFTLPPAGANAQLSSRPPRVEIVNPKPPSPVLADGKRVLVYELHVTNSGGERWESIKSTLLTRLTPGLRSRRTTTRR